MPTSGRARTKSHKKTLPKTTAITRAASKYRRNGAKLLRRITPSQRPNVPYSIARKSAVSAGETASAAGDVSERACSALLCTDRAIKNAAGPESIPSIPIARGCRLVSVIPHDTPAHTTNDHDTFDA